MLTTETPKENTDKEFEINLLDVAIVLAKHIKLIIAAPVIVAVLAFFITRQSPDLYTADTTFMPPQQVSSVSSMVSSLSSLGSLSGMLGGVSGVDASSNANYIAVLKSRTMRNDMIKKYKLLDVYKTKSMESARNALAGQTEIKPGKEGIIHLQVTDTNPMRAATLANGYVEVLLQKNNELALSEASQRCLAAEKEFLEAKNRLSDAENAVKILQESTGFITVGPQVAALQSMINITERQLAELSAYSTPNNPDYIKVRMKIANLQTEIGKAKAGSKYISKAPERVLEFTHKTRELKYAEALYQMAYQQLTLAKLNESKAGSTIQVFDRAVVPEQKSGPNRKNTVMISTIAALFLAVILALLIETYQRTKNNKDSVVQLNTIRKYLRLK